MSIDDEGQIKHYVPQPANFSEVLNKAEMLKHIISGQREYNKEAKAFAIGYIYGLSCGVNKPLLTVETWEEMHQSIFPWRNKI